MESPTRNYVPRGNLGKIPATGTLGIVQRQPCQRSLGLLNEIGYPGCRGVPFERSSKADSLQSRCLAFAIREFGRIWKSLGRARDLMWRGGEATKLGPAAAGAPGGRCPPLSALPSLLLYCG